MSKIRVLFFYPSEFPDSPMTVLTHIIRGLDRNRFEPYLVVNTGVRGGLGIGEADGVAIQEHTFGYSMYRGPGAALRSWFSLPISLASLVRFARREGIDIVHCCAGPRIGTLGLLLARLAGPRLLLHYHSVPGRSGGIQRAFEYAVGRRADHSVAVSRFIARQLSGPGVPAQKVDHVLNGVNLNKFNPSVDGSEMRREYGIPDGAPVVLQLARLVPWKRQEDLVRAFAISRSRIPELRCVLVGWEDPRGATRFPSYKAELLDLCKREKLGDSLIIANPRPQAPQLLAAADIVAMPSLGDPCPLAVLEAMATGKPVIGADSGGISEQILDGVTGFLVPPESPEAIAEKITLLASDARLRTAMGTAARRRAETCFDETRLGDAFAQIYERMVGAGSEALLSSCAPR